jgi:hypothetical protein
MAFLLVIDERSIEQNCFLVKLFLKIGLDILSGIFDDKCSFFYILYKKYLS